MSFSHCRRRCRSSSSFTTTLFRLVVVLRRRGPSPYTLASGRSTRHPSFMNASCTWCIGCAAAALRRSRRVVPWLCPSALPALSHAQNTREGILTLDTWVLSDRQNFQYTACRNSCRAGLTRVKENGPSTARFRQSQAEIRSEPPILVRPVLGWCSVKCRTFLSMMFCDQFFGARHPVRTLYWHWHRQKCPDTQNTT